MGIQVGAAQTTFQGFPNTTGMTASVASVSTGRCPRALCVSRRLIYRFLPLFLKSCAAATNLALVYCEKHGIITFYLTHAERLALADTPKESLMVEKMTAAWNELDKQIMPLIFYTGGAMSGCILANKIGFWCILVPAAVVLAMAAETLLFRHARVKTVPSVEVDESDDPAAVEVDPEAGEGDALQPLPTPMLSPSRTDRSIPPSPRGSLSPNMNVKHAIPAHSYAEIEGYHDWEI
jgi:hypothetical protein